MGDGRDLAECFRRVKVSASDRTGGATVSTYAGTEPLNLAAVRELAAAGAARREAAWMLVLALAEELERSRAGQATAPTAPDPRPEPVATDVVTLARNWFVSLFHGVDCGCASGTHTDGSWDDYRALADAIVWRVEVGRPVADTDAGRHAAVQVWLPLTLPDLAGTAPAERAPDAPPHVRDAAPTDQEARP